MKADTPIALASLTKMSIDEREQHISMLRERRLKPVKIYEELSLMQSEARKEKLEEQWEKALDMFEKDLLRADKAMLTLEARSRKLRAFELEIEQI